MRYQNTPEERYLHRYVIGALEQEHMCVHLEGLIYTLLERKQERKKLRYTNSITYQAKEFQG